MTRSYSSKTKLSWIALCALQVSAQQSSPGGLSDAQMSAVITQGKSLMNVSWIYGVGLDALTQWQYPSLSLYAFYSNKTSLGSLGRISDVTQPTALEAITDPIVNNIKSGQTTFFAGEGSADDTVSVGNAVRLVGELSENTTQAAAYKSAADNQLQHLLTAVPRNSNGTISTREAPDSPQLWDNFLYMALPFVATSGLMTENSTLLQIAVTQAQAYYTALRCAASACQHIVQGSYQDTRIWAIGNAWATAGMLQIVAAIEQSPSSSNFTEQRSTLVNYTRQILTSEWGARSNSTSFIPALLSNTTRYDDASATAFMAANTYRLASMGYDSSNLVANAESARQLVESNVGSDGWLMHSFNRDAPDTWGSNNVHSPEGQWAVVMMEAAWRDWKNITNAGTTSPANTTQTGDRAKSGASRSMISGLAATLALSGLFIVGI